MQMLLQEPLGADEVLVQHKHVGAIRLHRLHETDLRSVRSSNRAVWEEHRQWGLGQGPTLLVAESDISSSKAPAGRGSKNTRPSCAVKSLRLWSSFGSAEDTHIAAAANTRERVNTVFKRKYEDAT